MNINKLNFCGRTFNVVLHPKIIKFKNNKPKYSCDLEVVGWKGKMTGDDYRALRNYLTAEGYIEQAYSSLNN